MSTKLTYPRFACLFVFSLLYSGTLLADLVNIDNKQLQNLLNEKTLIIDVRRAEEWVDTGVVESSQLLTFFDKNGNVNAQKWYSDISKFSDTSTPVILICRTGSRSKVIGDWMVKTLGYQNVYNVADGIIGWKRASGKTLAP
ncbi:MAG: rhodanese-related sulfurtransferase [Polaribacter sp.]|jgi:rhodanese-related sulfurtransferase